MKQTLFALILAALAPVAAIAGPPSGGNGGQAATAEKACAFHQATCSTVDKRMMSIEW